VSFTKPASSTIPDAPGAYLFRDEDGRVVYVGKAGSLRKRLASYWSRPLHPRTEAMVDAAASVEWIVASGEVDALMLEFNLIQQHLPRFNVRYRDDKSYPYLALTVGEKWPRAQVLRGTKRKKVRYFGPYGHAWAIRDTLDALTRVFPIRTCTNHFFDQRARAGRPCLYYDIGRCSGPCVPSQTGITQEAYRQDVDALGDFLAGNSKPVLKRLDQQMAEASGREEYEQAARFRDQLQAARRALESQEMVLVKPEHLDVVGLAEDDLEAAFQVFTVRGGRVLGRKGWVVDRVEDLDRPELIASFLRQLYMEREEVPPRILVPTGPSDRDVLETWLSGRRGSQVTIAVPARGAKRRLMEVVASNAAEAFHRHKLRRASDFGARSRALSELADQLGLEQAPLRIECYDISNLGPTDTVGSMVVFEDGLPKRSDYRRFEIKGVAGQDDFASMEEMLTGRPLALLVPAGAGRRGRRARSAERRHEGARGHGSAHPPRRPGQAARGDLLPRSPGPALDRPRVRGALRAPAHPGRGASLRDHVPPAAARSPSALVAPRRDPGRRALAEASPVEAIRLPHEDPPGGAGRPRRHTGRGSPARGRDPSAAARARGLRPAGERVMTRTAGRRDAEAATAPPGFLLITGLSGAGRSEAARSLEDLGYFVVDNLPPALLPKMAELAASPGGPGRVAIVVDARGGVFFGELSRALEELREQRVPSRILFLDASDDDLVNRYEATRRRHPLAPADRVGEGIRKERLMMESLRADADLVIDTTGLTPHDLRDRIRETFAQAPPEAGLLVSVVSFGFKYGSPRDADLVLDVRFLPNPHWVDELRPLPGSNQKVREYVEGQEEYGSFMKRLEALFDVVVPGYVDEGKSYLTVAIGCTGGRHRSVVVADDLADYFREHGHRVSVNHRDVDRD